MQTRIEEGKTKLTIGIILYLQEEEEEKIKGGQNKAIVKGVAGWNRIQGSRPVDIQGKYFYIKMKNARRSKVYPPGQDETGHPWNVR